MTQIWTGVLGSETRVTPLQNTVINPVNSRNMGVTRPPDGRSGITFGSLASVGRHGRGEGPGALKSPLARGFGSGWGCCGKALHFGVLGKKCQSYPKCNVFSHNSVIYNAPPHCFVIYRGNFLKVNLGKVTKHQSENTTSPLFLCQTI